VLHIAGEIRREKEKRKRKKKNGPTFGGGIGGTLGMEASRRNLKSRWS
jgi:hypothetical protein